MADVSRIAAEILLSLQPMMAGADVIPPKMIALEPQALQMRVCGKPCKVLAWYGPEGVIYIDNRLDIENAARDRSVVVHELVHHIQRMSLGSRAGDCAEWVRREQEAYMAQARWLRSKGLRANSLSLQARFLRCDSRTGSGETFRAPGSETDLSAE